MHIPRTSLLGVARRLAWVQTRLEPALVDPQIPGELGIVALYPQSVLRPDAECGELVGSYCGNLRDSPPIGSLQPRGAAMGLALDDEISSADSYKLNIRRGAAD